MKNIFNFFLVIIFLSSIIVQTGCKKYVTVGAPATSVNEGNIYKNDATAISVLTGIYIRMAQLGTFTGGPFGISLRLGCSADEFTLNSNVTDNDLIAYYGNQIVSIGGSQDWGPIYSYIFQCNAVIEGLNTSTGLTPSVKQQLTGEAQFMRAFFYFYLVNMFGDVPLALGTNYKVNEALSRSPKVQVYQQMITDMKDAQNLLSDNYLDRKLQNSAARVRPTRWAAGALLARVYLYTGDWANAETEASSIINNSLLYQLEALDNVFNVSSQEAIWQLQSVVAGHGTEEAYLFILPSSGTSSDNPVYLSSSLLSSIETNDQRKIKWISSVTPPSNPTYFYPFKYQENTLASGSATQYLTVFRLAEQYLIRAEAQAQGAGGGLPGAINDLNAIRNRAELPAYSGPSNNKDSVLAAIL